MKTYRDLADLAQALYYAVMAQYMAREHASQVWKDALKNFDREEVKNNASS